MPTLPHRADDAVMQFLEQTARHYPPPASPLWATAEEHEVTMAAAADEGDCSLGSWVAAASPDRSCADADGKAVRSRM